LLSNLNFLLAVYVLLRRLDLAPRHAVTEPRANRCTLIAISW